MSRDSSAWTRSGGLTRRFLVLALLAKLVALAVRAYVIYVVYDGSADAPGYIKAGREIAGVIRSGRVPAEATTTGTEFMEFLVGALFAISVQNVVLAFVALTLLSFAGLWLFHRAFVIAVPEGDHRLHALLVFFLPTLLFWTSSVGKEAAITFGFGLASYGVARIYRRLRWGYVALAPGLLLTFMIRPHMAALFAGAFAAGFVVRPAVPGQDRAWGPWAAGLVAAAIAGVVLIGTLDSALPVDAEQGGSIFEQVSAVTEDRTSQGGSVFANRPVTDPFDLPHALITVPFRPFPWEVLDNPQAVLAGVEGLVLLGLVLASAARLRRLPWTALRTPLVMMSAAYTVGFCIAFSSIGNFGILARQRAQLLPFLVVLLCLPAAAGRPAATVLAASDGRTTDPVRSPHPAAR